MRLKPFNRSASRAAALLSAGYSSCSCHTSMLKLYSPVCSRVPDGGLGMQGREAHCQLLHRRML
jgi:hypothetical protein